MLRPVSNPPPRFAATCLAWEVPPPPATLRVYVDDSKDVLSRNDSPDLGFRWSVNPYRGCFHACSYCYARPSHEYLGFGAGTDFERLIVVKPEAAQLLEAAFRGANWKGEVILFSGNTDCYQPLEAEYALTRACLAVCVKYRQPVSIITKSTIILRDVDLLTELQRVASAHVVLSIPFMDAANARAIEPNAPPPKLRLRVVRALTEAGVPVGVNIAPVIPGLNDRDVPAILKAARAAGASWANLIPVRLAEAVQPVFEARLRETMPGRADGILARIRRARGGELNEPRFGMRFSASGPEWESTKMLFDLWHDRLGFVAHPEPARDSFRVPGGGVQVGLFG